jgi:hypothetical protein
MSGNASLAKSLVRMHMSYTELQPACMQCFSMLTLVFQHVDAADQLANHPVACPAQCQPMFCCQLRTSNGQRSCCCSNDNNCVHNLSSHSGTASGSANRLQGWLLCLSG